MFNLTPSQLRLAADLQEKIAGLKHQLAGITGTQAAPIKTSKPAKKGMSAAGRAKVAAAQKARWVKIHAAKGKPVVKVKKARKKMSAEAKAKISAAAKARWAKVRADAEKK
jgi:hypothetical protein